MKAQTAKTEWKEPKIYDKNANMLVPYYLMYSYLYYEKDSPIVSDTEYDTICKRLYDEWDTIEHYHKHIINKEDLTAGTGYTLKYPTIVKDTALLLKEKQSGTNRNRVG